MVEQQYLFRGKRLDNGEMIFGDLRLIDEVPWIARTTFINGGYVDVSREVTPESVGQYISRDDKLGVKIFENDIVTDGHNLGVVFYHVTKHMHMVDCSHFDVGPMDDWDQYIVIGNTMDDGEILEGELNPESLTFSINYKRWERDCRQELRDQGFIPSEWEISADDGTIYFKPNRFFHIRDAVTPWHNSPHFVPGL